MGQKKQLKKNQTEEIFTILFLLCFVLQFLFISYDCLFMTRHHLGYDCSASLLKAAEMKKQKTLFIKNFMDTTTLQIDSPAPLAALLHFFIKDIFLAYGIALWILDIAFFALFYFTGKSLKMSKLASVIALNLVSMSYLDMLFNNVNDLGYYSCMYVNFGASLVKMGIMLMVIKTVADLTSKEKPDRNTLIFAGATECMLFVAALSSGLYLAITVLLPLAILLVILVFVKNDISILKKPVAQFVYIAAGLTLIGKSILSYGLGFKSRDSIMALIPLEEFWKNLTSIWLGFLQLTGALPTEAGGEVRVFTRNGIDFVLALVIVTILVISFVHMCRDAKKNYEQALPKAYMSIVIILNVLMFSVLKMNYSAMIYEYRYLIPFLIILSLACGYFVDSLPAKAQLFKYAGLLVLLVSVLGSNVLDHRLYQSRVLDLNEYDELKRIVEEQAPGVIYGFGEDIRVDVRNMRVVDLNHVYKTVQDWNPVDLFHYGGDYEYYDYLTDAPQRNMLIVTQTNLPNVPESLLSEYTYVTSSGKYLIYMSDTNRIEQGGYV